MEEMTSRCSLSFPFFPFMKASLLSSYFLCVDCWNKRHRSSKKEKKKRKKKSFGLSHKIHSFQIFWDSPSLVGKGFFSSVSACFNFAGLKFSMSEINSCFSFSCWITVQKNFLSLINYYFIFWYKYNFLM